MLSLLIPVIFLPVLIIFCLFSRNNRENEKDAQPSTPKTPKKSTPPPPKQPLPPKKPRVVTPSPKSLLQNVVPPQTVPGPELDPTQRDPGTLSLTTEEGDTKDDAPSLKGRNLDIASEDFTLPPNCDSIYFKTKLRPPPQDKKKPSPQDKRKPSPQPTTIIKEDVTVQSERSIREIRKASKEGGKKKLSKELVTAIEMKKKLKKTKRDSKEVNTAEEKKKKTVEEKKTK